MFFDEEHLKDTELNQLVKIVDSNDIQNSKQPIITVKLTCSSSGRGVAILGDTNGYVYIINRHYKVNSFRANQKHTSHVKQVPKLSIVLSCGSDSDGINPLIKLWDLDKTDSLNQPNCIRVIRANVGFSQPTPVTCLECNDNLSCLIVGYKDGSIVLHHGDITKQRRSKNGKPMKISEFPITAIVMRGEVRIKQQLSTATGYLTQPTVIVETRAFITTSDEVFHVTFSEKNTTKVRIDQMGCQPRCTCLLASPDSKTANQANENLLAVGRDNAVYFYQVDGRGPCLAFEGQKLVVYRFKNYLVIVSRDAAGKLESSLPSARSRWTNDKTSQNYFQKSIKTLNLNIYDIRNKYIAHSSSIPDIQEIFCEWGQLFIITSDGNVMSFREKDTQTKLDTLFRKNQFGLVIEIAKSHHYGEDALTDIFKHYGDHLYKKGDFDGAISQYIKTIGKSEPSYVIKKFLDSKRIGNLTVYLEALHKKSYASHEHTRLLLNCYSKLKDDRQLKQFIESYEEDSIKFDVEIAIKVLRDAGSYELALYLAKKHQKHEFFFRIQIEDRSDSLAAIEYLNGMADSNEMAIYLKRYGRTMVKDAPEKTIMMVKTLCQRSQEAIAQSRQANLHKSNIVDDNQLNMYNNITRQIYPEEFFHIFVDNTSLFVKLLEQLVESGTDFATKAVYNLLLELYLNAWRKEKDDLLKNGHADKIEKLLSQPGEKFDLDQALILCRNNRFDDGLIYLYSRAGLYHLVLQYYIDQEDSLKIIKTCEKYGNENPKLHMPALMYYARTGDERVTQILKAIEHHKLIPPAVVIKILLESKRASLGSVKDYMVRYLKKLYENHLDNGNAIDHYKDDTEVVRQRIEEFKNHQTVFKPSKCSVCQGMLDLPSVHFLCGHSYHQNCFHNYSAESDECPICVTTNRKLLDEIGSHETSKLRLCQLEKEFLQPTDDIFNSLAKLFGYGLFN